MKKDVLSRRRFLRMGAGGAAALAAAASGLGADPASGQAGDAQSGRLNASAFPKIPFSLGAASYTFREFGLEDAIKMTQRVALPRICLKDMHLPIDSSAAQIAEVVGRIRATGLVPYGCGVVYMKSGAEVERAFAYARSAGFEIIVGVPDHGLLPLVEKKVRETGIRLAVHNHGPGDLLYPTPAVVLDRVKALDPRIGICLDVGHCIRAGVDPADAAAASGARLLDVHLKDETAAAAEGEPIEAGRGVIHLPRFLRTLVQMGFRGTAAFEYEKDGRDPLPGLAESVGYVRGILASF